VAFFATVLLANGHNQFIPILGEYGGWPKKSHVFHDPGALRQTMLSKAVGLKTSSDEHCVTRQ